LFSEWIFFFKARVLFEWFIRLTASGIFDRRDDTVFKKHYPCSKKIKITPTPGLIINSREFFPKMY